MTKRRSTLPPYTRKHARINGKMQIRYPIAKTNGKWSYEVVYCEEGEVWDKYDQLQAKYGGRVLSGEDKLLCDWLTEFHITRKRIKPTTLATYKRTIDIIKGVAPNATLRKLDKATVWQILDGCYNYSHRTQRYVLMLLKGALTNAVSRGLIASNPALEVALQKRTQQPAVGKSFTFEQLHVFCKAAHGHTNGLILTTTALLGLRIGEAMALASSDVVAGDTPYITVRRTAQTVSGKSIMGDSTKTAAGNRRVYLPADLAKALLDQVEVSKAVGSELLFPSRVGTLLLYANIRRSWLEILEVAGLEPMRIHDLRHTCNTLMHAKGVDSETRKLILGHSLNSTINEAYLHIQDERLVAASRAMEGFCIQ